MCREVPTGPIPWRTRRLLGSSLPTAVPSWLSGRIPCGKKVGRVRQLKGFNIVTTYKMFSDKHEINKYLLSDTDTVTVYG